MKSEDEEFCKSKFDEFVRRVSGPSLIQWDDVAQQDEPPDYFLYIDGTKYAVEVTILMEKLEVGNLQLPQVAVVASLWRLVDEVEATARRSGFLKGAYVVTFSRPIANFNEVRKQLFDDLLSYVKATQHVSTAPEKIVFKQGIQKCAIRKFQSQKSYIGKMGPSGGKWEGEAAEEICTLLEDRINDKHHKLRNITYPKILLLYDAYRFAGPEMFKSCLSKFVHLNSFYTVFIVPSNEDGWILHSENSNWRSSIPKKAA